MARRPGGIPSLLMRMATLGVAPRGGLAQKATDEGKGGAQRRGHQVWLLAGRALYGSR
jgi:hypothetical protein